MDYSIKITFAAAIFLVLPVNAADQSPPAEPDALITGKSVHYSPWATGGARSQEKVIGRAKKNVGNTVDVAKASYQNTIGDATLAAYWQDPDFDPQQQAFYYVRVLEIPTPRWTTIDAKLFKREIPKGAPTSIQERAYTSPIWYTPS